MASSLSNYLEAKLLDHMVNKAAFTAPTVVACALFTTLPDDASTGASLSPGVEVSGGSYARIDTRTHNAGGTVWGSASATGTGQTAGSITTIADITFATATASWGTIVGVGLFDSTTIGAGNLLCYGDLTATKTVGNGDVFKFLTGQLTLTLN